MPVAAPPAGVPGLSAVDLTPERIQLIGMRTATVKREELTGELRTVGLVAPRERGFAQITTRFGGWIEKLTVSDTGARVRSGDVLATMYSPDVLKAEQELLVARGWTAEAGNPRSPQDHDSFTRSLDTNARRRLELLGISSRDIDEVLRSGKASVAIAIRSPVDGYVVGKNAVVGPRRSAGHGAVRGRRSLEDMGDGRGLRGRRGPRARGPAGPFRAGLVPGRHPRRDGPVHLPGGRPPEPDPARAARVPEPLRQERAAFATRHVRHRAPGPSAHQRADGARRGGRRYRGRCTTSSWPGKAATSSRGR
jgi:hypothetical protein